MKLELSDSAKAFLQNNGRKYLGKNDVEGFFKKAMTEESAPTAAELYAFLLEKGVNAFDYINKVPNFFFAGCQVKSLKTIDITKPTYIGVRAFAESPYLMQVNIGDNVEVIDKEAFIKCPSLKRVNLGSSVRAIRSEAFADTKLQRIDLPESVTVLGTHVFPEDCYVVSGHRKKNSIRFPKNELDWYRKHLVLDPALRPSAQAGQGGSI